MLAFYFLLLFVATFSAVLLALLLSYMRLQRDGSSASMQFSGSQILKQDTHSSFSFVHYLVERLNVADHLRLLLDEAALPWSVGRMFTMMLLCGTVSAALAMYLPFIPGWGVPLLATLGALIPYFYVREHRVRRIRKFEEQFPDALDSLSNALRAGHPMSVAFQNLAQESPAPLGSEIRKVVELQRLGYSWEAALENLQRRIPTVEIAMFASAVETHLRTGGNLGEVLGRLAETMRESQSLVGEVRALSSHGRLTGLVLTILPGIVAGILTFAQPDYFQPLINHPQGKNLILAAIGMLIAAHFIIRWIVDVEA